MEITAYLNRLCLIYVCKQHFRNKCAFFLCNQSTGEVWCIYIYIYIYIYILNYCTVLADFEQRVKDSEMCD